MRRLALEEEALGATRSAPSLLSIHVPAKLSSADGELQLHLRVATIEQLLAIEHVYAALTADDIEALSGVFAGRFPPAHRCPPRSLAGCLGQQRRRSTLTPHPHHLPVP